MIEQTSHQPRAWEESVLGQESLSGPHLLDTWAEGLTINRNEPEPDAEPAMTAGGETDDTRDPDPPTWGATSLDEKIEDVYRLAAHLLGAKGPRLLDAYLQTGTTVGAGKALGVSRKTCHEWFKILKEGALAARA